MKTAKQFTDTLREIRGGTVIDDLTEELRKLVQAVNLTGGSGKLTLNLTVKRASKGVGNTLVISDDIKIKMPVTEKGETILFANDDGELTRSDPRQPKLAYERPAAPVLQGPGAEQNVSAQS